MVVKFHHTAWWNFSTHLVMVEKFHHVGGDFSTCLQMVENSTKKGGYGMVEFFHPLSDGVKIPPCWWRFWTTIIGGIFHLFPLQCGYTKEKRYTNK